MDSCGYSYAASYELLVVGSWNFVRLLGLICKLAGWLAGGLAGWRAGWPAGQLVGWPNGPGMSGLLVGCSVGWLVGRLVGWPAGWLAGLLVD